MTRSLALLVVTLSVVSTLLGVAMSERPVLAVLAAAVLGGAVAALLLRRTRTRLRRLYERARTLTQPRTSTQPAERDAHWRRVSEELERAGAGLAERLDDLQEQRARVLRVLESLPPAVLLFEPDRLTYANTSARQLFRLDARDLHPTGQLTAMQAVGMKVLADAVERTAGGGVEQEVEAVREDRVFFARTSRLSEGEVALVLTDLTEPRRLDAVRRDFVTNASHELKTPVAGIQALADSLSLAARRDPDRARRMIGRLQTEAERLASLVRDLLDLARVEELEDPRRAGRVELSQIIALQLQRIAPVARQYSVTVRSSLASSAWVTASPEDMRLIVDNLLQNAVRYNRPGGSVDVRVSRTEGEVVLEVADTGIGIPESDRERIFERFYRVDKARSRAAGGTGLGLSLVRHATQRMGGDLGVASVLGQGSTFTVVLPAAPAAPGQGAVPARATG